MEFTIENEELFVLQSCAAKRSPRAAVNIAVSLVRERLITEREALLRVNPQHMEYVQQRVRDTDSGENCAHCNTNITWFVTIIFTPCRCTGS